MELPLIFGLGVIVKKYKDNLGNKKHLIECWKDVCVKYQGFYENKTQRGYIEKLVKELGEEKYLKAVGFLPKLLTAKYAPVITDPKRLWEKLERYRSFINNSEDWKKAWVEFTPHKMNEDGRKKYQNMRLKLVAKTTKE